MVLKLPRSIKSLQPGSSVTNEAIHSLRPEEQGRLVVNCVSKEYSFKGKSVLAVENVSFAVDRGEICVLLGPSGCGKSTLLRMVAGLLPASSGEITLNGKPISGSSRERGMVFQRYTSFPWLTVQKNVEYGLSINGYSRKHQREIANHYIEKVKLSRFRDAYPEQLSGGMRQRVAIARTLANGPDILLMDEPFGALDAETRWQMQELLLDIVQQEKITTLVVTHDVEEALLIADKIIFLSSHPGTIRECIVPPTRDNWKPKSKEDMLGNNDYIELEKKIMRMMREEVTNAAKCKSFST